MTKKEMKTHLNHDIEITTYEKDNIIYNYALECTTCMFILESHDCYEKKKTTKH